MHHQLASLQRFRLQPHSSSPPQQLPEAPTGSIMTGTRRDSTWPAHVCTWEASEPQTQIQNQVTHDNNEPLPRISPHCPLPKGSRPHRLSSLYHPPSLSNSLPHHTGRRGGRFGRRLRRPHTLSDHHHHHIPVMPAAKGVGHGKQNLILFHESVPNGVALEPVNLPFARPDQLPEADCKPHSEPQHKSKHAHKD